MLPFANQNHYERLQVGPNATEKELSQAYRRLAKKHHPDVAIDKYNSLRAFLSIRESYEILSDPVRRKDFNKQLEYMQRRRSQNAERANVRPSKAPFFSSKKTTPSPQGRVHSPALDIHASIQIELEVAILGGRQSIKLEVESAQCAPHYSNLVNVMIPSQCPNGHVIKVASRGFYNKATGEIGDLHLTLKYAEHERFNLRGKDLCIALDIYPWDAATGMAYSIPTPGGKAALEIPPGTYHWQIFRLKGHGMPDKTGRHGDLLVSVKIKQPTAITKEQQRLWKQLRASYGV
jgi:curved DNA-binding protein